MCACNTSHVNRGSPSEMTRLGMPRFEKTYAYSNSAEPFASTESCHGIRWAHLIECINRYEDHVMTSLYDKQCCNEIHRGLFASCLQQFPIAAALLGTYLYYPVIPLSRWQNSIAFTKPLQSASSVGHQKYLLAGKMVLLILRRPAYRLSYNSAMISSFCAALSDVTMLLE